MVQISGVYKTQHGDLTLSQNGENITGSYQENGVCSGKLTGNKVEGVWKNKKDQGMFEWTFDGHGSFVGKYKNGVEPGAMRGKWNGKLRASTTSETKADAHTVDTVEVTLSGRIPKYFFGRVKEEFQDEIQSALSFADEEVETEEDLLKALLNCTLEDRENAREQFRNLVSLERLEEECPNLFQVFNEIEEYDLDHMGLYDALFDTADYWQGGTGFITFFEDDCTISISINGEEKLAAMKLGDFAANTSGYHSENEPENEDEERLNQEIKAFIAANAEEFGLPDEMGMGINAQGARFAEVWFTPPALEDVSDRSNSVTVYHDDIIDYTFYFETERFDFKKLLFLTYANYSDFRGNSLTTLANYLFYDNQIVQPDESWHRDKGIELSYESKDVSLDFLING